MNMFPSGILPRSTQAPGRDDDRSMTARAIERLRQQQARQIADEPMTHPMQGVSQLAEAAVAGLLDRKLSHEEAQAAEREQQARAAAMRRLTEAMEAQQAPPAPPGGQMAPTGSPAGAQGGSGYDWLIQRESGGDPAAMNEHGYAGRAQFGRDRLQDAIRAGVIPEGTTPEMLTQYPDMQPGLEEWHFGDLERQVDAALAAGAPEEIGGIPVTREGLVAVAHLGGAEGMRQLLESGGAYNPADAYGTNLLDYLALGAQHAGGGAPQAPQAAAPPTEPDPTAIMAAMMDPALPPEARQIAMLMLDRAEPADPVSLAPGHHLVDPRTGRPIYEAPTAEDPSTIATLMAERDALPPGDPRREEYNAAIARAGGGTTVNVDTAQPYGAPRPGERIVLDEEGRPVRIEPIPGGEIAREAEEEAQAEAAAAEQTIQTASVVQNAAAEAANLIDRHGWLTAGPLGGAMSMTGLSEVSALIDTVRSNVALDTIVRLKESGGTLGQVSEKELQLLGDKLGKISVWMPPEVLQENLNFIADTYGQIIEDLSAAPAAGKDETGKGRREGEDERAGETGETPPPGGAAGRIERRKAAEGAVEFPAELDGIMLGERSARDVWEQLTPEARKQLVRDLGAL